MVRHLRIACLTGLLTATVLIPPVLSDPPVPKGHPEFSPPIPSTAAPFSRGEAIEVPGCRVKLAEEAILASDRSGILDFVVSREGTQVRAGEEIAHLRDNVIRATLAIAETEASNDVEVRFAEKASELAQHKYFKDLQINQSLPGAVTEHDIRESRLSAERALLQFEQAKQQLAVQELKRDETREMLKNYSVKAPFNGVIRTIFKRRGEAVGEGEPIAELVNTELVRVEGAVPLDVAPLIRPGSRVEIVPELETATTTAALGFYGQIVFVDVKVEPVSGRIRIIAEVQNKHDQLKDGLKAAMLIVPSPLHNDPAKSARLPGERVPGRR